MLAIGLCPTTVVKHHAYRTAGMRYHQVERIINSSELRGADFNLQEVIPPALEAAARSGRRMRGAGLRQLEGMGRKRFILSPEDDNELRSRCE